MGSTLTKECGTTTCRECPKTSMCSGCGIYHHALLEQFHWPNLGNRHVRLNFVPFLKCSCCCSFPLMLLLIYVPVDIVHLHSLTLLHCSYMLMPLLFRASLIPALYICVESFIMQGPVCHYCMHLKTFTTTPVFIIVVITIGLLCVVSLLAWWGYLCILVFVIANVNA